MFSQNTKKFAKFLYVSGNKLESISERLNVAVSTISLWRQKGQWHEEKIPPFSIDDLFEAAKQLYLLVFFDIIEGKSENSLLEDITCINKLTSIMKALAEIAPLRQEAVVGFTKWAIETKDSKEDISILIQKAHQYYDSMQETEEPKQIQ